MKLKPEDVLLYIHIPKTGGTSLISILDAQFPDKEVFPLHSTAGENYYWALSRKELQRFRFVRGHYRFGPYDRDIYKHIVQNPIRITMVREPIQRTISGYRHILRTPGHRWHASIVSSASKLRDFLTDPKYSLQVSNLQTRVIIGAYPARASGLARPQNTSDEALVVFAKQLLEQHAFVGLMERFEESVQLLMYTFGWAPVEEIPRMNVATDSFSIDSIPEDLMQVLRSRTALDRELYDHAVEMFDRRMARMKEELRVCA
jgi:hypothetical protein